MPSELESSGAEPLAAELRELQALADSFGRAMTTAFRRSVVDGRALEDVLKSLALSLSSRALNQALAPIGQGLFSGLFGSLLRGRQLQGGALGQATSLAGGSVSSSGPIGSRTRRWRTRRRECRVPRDDAGCAELSPF